ncbi:hypothetical protein ACLOJK_002469 [Asimina triloba]
MVKSRGYSPRLCHLRKDYFPPCSSAAAIKLTQRGSAFSTPDPSLSLHGYSNPDNAYSGHGWWLRNDLNDLMLQKTLDYACGAGADCNPIHQTGACYNPNTVKAHCSYAVNSYFQKKGQAQGTCDFSGTATVVTADPSKARER